MANTSLLHTNTGTGSYQKSTFSAWIKRTKTNTSEPNLGSIQCMWNNKFDGSNQLRFDFDASDKIYLYGEEGGGYSLRALTTTVFKDTSGWYHIVVAIDTTQSNATNRIKLYVNGSLQTLNFSTTPGQNANLRMNYNAKPVYVGSNAAANYFKGVMSHVHWVDGTAYAASTFGSTDSTTGQWKINTSPSVTYGQNGFFILKDSNSVTDQSGQSNNFTVASGAITKSEDCPTNVFTVYNQLLNIPSSELSNGATTINNASSGSTRPILSSLGASSGKFYAEFKTVTASSASRVGICAMDKYVLTEFTGVNALSYGYLAGGTVANNNSNTITGLSSYSSGDIIGVAMDLDNNYLYFRKNNLAWENSGNPTSGSTGTGGQAITANNTYGFHVTVGPSSKKTSANFGNGYFATSAISSAGTNASNNGIFEYAVPSGYTALSTKGLNL